jgi:hypothetical protein
LCRFKLRIAQSLDQATQLDRECHYDIDITPDNHLEFTLHADDARITCLGSATNKGNRTYWKESLSLVNQ